MNNKIKILAITGITAIIIKILHGETKFDPKYGSVYNDELSRNKHLNNMDKQNT